MKARIAIGCFALLMLMVCWTFWWRINFINKHPDEYMDCGMPPIWDYRYWPLVKQEDIMDRRLQPTSPGSGMSWSMPNNSNGAVVMTNKLF